MMCKVMGIVNVTPDSFSDGGKYFAPEEAVRRAKNLVAEGADILDVGGESTRPGATPISWEEEWQRIEPVLGQLAARDSRLATCISVDTYHPETAERAIKAGARIINCVYSEPIPEMLKLIEGNDVELVVPYRLGDEDFRRETLDANIASRLYLDPLIGFNTTREEDIALLRSIPELAKRGRVLVGASRKRIVKKLVGAKTSGKDIAGNLAIALYAAANGASAVRVHDVKETVQALKVWNSLR